MINIGNLTDQIKKQLPTDLVDFLLLAGNVARGMGCRLFLVGGVVRDLLLHRVNLDLDLVVEGDAIRLAEEMARIKSGRVIAHSRFNTAKIKWGKWSVDIATARAESYEKPGALPSFEKGCDIRSDLIRRDFTINAMAICLDPDNYGELIESFRGLDDLEKGLIRVLHDESFKDDATRIWRAVRYEQRLGFSIEPHTLDLLQRDLKYLDTISGDRIRHELELCLEEDRPEKCLVRAGNLGLLGRMCPALEADNWVTRKIIKARGMLQPYCPPQDLNLAFLIYRLSSGDLANLITYLNFNRSLAKTLEDTLLLKDNIPLLSGPQIAPSRIYHILHQYSATAILANLIATDSPLIQERIESFLNHLRYVQVSLSGEEIIKMGVAAGPHVKAVLESLREARLDGQVTTREDEIALVDKIRKAVN